MSKKTIGDQELALLQYIEDAPKSSVAEVVAGYGESRGLARSTVLTMMERLRAKGYLTRRRIDGSFRYSAINGTGEVMTGAVARFVQNTLQGSVSPFVAWMSERGQVSDSELAELEALVDTLQSRREKR
ncbi:MULTISPECIES: BlaI/MecI/CopY family transcriptional regulator [unclassified Luteibacter]|uniref:BlaI/MecI/CopY family transcriptional regulator n=1 Tax=unclassified Luteibacter TaxID=2620188 RepID=UPI0008CB0472|nr:MULTISPECIES: BlaI/MecI/CopY family transcriptional regulator [unclassified Luteibacter]SEO68155.1 Predicted transcriptional regulator [Luteibacter sp. UNC138MFCol5.1]SEV83195.1 Predicted transcriptional regulator [Luteibacter sp. 329MFSha]